MTMLERGQDLGINYKVDKVDGAAGATWLLFNGATLPLEFWDPVVRVLAAQAVSYTHLTLPTKA